MLTTSRPAIPREKHAGGDDADDTGFEQSFSAIAHAYLTDRAPGLLDYEVGFQLVDRDDDGKKAAGVFGFKVGNRWFYAPVIYVNNELKGYELLYVKDDDQFVPLKENWISHLLSKRPTVLGEGVSRRGRDLGIHRPDLTPMLQSPYKQGSWAPGERDALRAEAARSMAKVADTPAAAALSRLPDWTKVAWVSLARAIVRPAPARDLVLPAVLKEAGLPGLRALHAALDAFPSLRVACDSFYDADTMTDAMRKAATYPGCGMPKRRRRRRKTQKSALAALDAGLRTAKVAVYRDGDRRPPLLDDADCERLRGAGILIKDAREDDEVSKAYAVDVKVQFPKAFTSPSESGVYDVLVKDGTTARCFVGFGPHGPDRAYDFCTVVRLKGTKKAWLNVHPSYVWVRPQPEDYRAWFDGLPEAGSLPDGYAMAVGPRGECTVPMIRRTDRGEDAGGGKAYDVTFDSDSDRPRSAMTTGGPIGHRWWDYGKGYDAYVPHRDGERVHLGQKTGTKLRSTKGDLYVPAGYRLLKLDDDSAEPEDEEALGKAQDKREEKERKEDEVDPTRTKPDLAGASEEGPEFILGDALDIQMGILAKTAALALRHDGIRVAIDDGPRLLRKEAIVHLVRDRGFRETAAGAMVDEAVRLGRLQKAAEFRVKYAAGYPGGGDDDPYLTHGGPRAPGIDDELPSADGIMGDRAPAYTGYEERVPVEDMATDPGNRDFYRYDPDDSPDPGAVQVAQDAAASGQKELFDTAMVGSLLKTTRDDSLIDKHLPVLLDNLDALGRLILLYYWRPEKFAERYGQEDMPELEESLRNAFDVQGDLTLFLKQKATEASPDEAAQAIDLGDGDEG
jgi:hypothetical protein